MGTYIPQENGMDYSKTEELLSRSTLETHKLDLMAEISNLKLRLATSEREKKELAIKYEHSQKQINEIQSRLNDRTIEVTELRSRLAKNGTIPSSFDSDSWQMRTLERERTLDRLKRKHLEVEKLRKAVETLLIANEEKDKCIDSLNQNMKRLKKIEQFIMSSERGKKLIDGLDEGSSSDSTQHSSPSVNVTVKEAHPHQKYSGDRPNGSVHPQRAPFMPSPSATSTPVNSYVESPRNGHGPPPGNDNANLTPPSVINIHSPSYRNSPTPSRQQQVARANSCEEMPYPTKTPPTAKRQAVSYSTMPNMNQPQRIDSTGSLPNQRRDSSGLSPHRDSSRTSPHQRKDSGGLPPHPQRMDSGGSLPRSAKDSTNSLPRKTKGVTSFGKGFFKIRPSRWSSSSPNLAQTDDEEVVADQMALQYKALTMGQGTENFQVPKKKNKGIRRFFGRLRRSSSQDFDGDKVGDFKRSGLRATAGPRLGWSQENKDANIPFSLWDCDRISIWFHSIGLSMYIGECRRWVKNGEQLLKASGHDLEKELCIRHPLHKKKLQLALQAIGSDTGDRLSELDHNWIQKWLDDIGLPQYKDQFMEARIDGRILHYLTVEDLVTLRVTNELHHVSLRRAIQVLRLNGFNPNCLRRRPVPDEGPIHNAPEEVMLWSNHRVMEWLRTIDLSEYAPNLRGSGVHGGLMIFEERFNTEIFAALLSIPVNKTLLRRHLSTHFVSLIGNVIQIRKRDYEASNNFVPLTQSAKIKVPRRIFHKRSRSETDFVCPMNTAPVSPDMLRRDISPHSAELKQIDQKAAQEIGVFSHEINSLTTMLSKERFMDDVPTSNV